MPSDILTWLEEVEARCEAATDGPWVVPPLSRGKYYGTNVELSDGNLIRLWGSRKWEPSWRERETWQGEPAVDDSEIMTDGHYEDAQDLANAELIAAARTDIPRLTRAVRELVEMVPHEDGCSYGTCAECGCFALVEASCRCTEAGAKFKLSDCICTRPARIAKAIGGE